jgi:hypothetical protein
MFRKYQNELIVLFAALLLLGAVLFQYTSYRTLQKKSTESVALISQFQDIATMKKLWGKNKTRARVLGNIQKTLAKEKVQKFKIEKNKAHIVLENLTGSELNKVVGKQFASIPVQITELDITRNGEKYRLELKCKW